MMAYKGSKVRVATTCIVYITTVLFVNVSAHKTNREKLNKIQPK